MFEVYEVEWWVLWLYAIAIVVFFLAAAFGWIIASALNKNNGRANEGWQKSIALNKGLNDRANKAEANARESDAAHREAVRLLEAEQVEKAKWKSMAEAYQAKAAKFHQKRGKDGKFAPKKKVK